MLQKLGPEKNKGLPGCITGGSGFYLLLAGLLIFSIVLAACGSPGSTTSSGPVTLTFGWWSNTPTKDNAMRAWVASFERAHPDIKVNLELLPWADYWEKLRVTIGGGNAYDIIGLCSCNSASYLDDGALVDLTTLAGYQDATKNLVGQSLALNTWNDKVYGLPVGTSISLLGYSKKLLKAAGVPYPDPVTPLTFEQFKAMAKKLTSLDGPKAQYALNPSNILDFDTFVRMEGGHTYDNPINPHKITINTPEGVQGLSDYLSLFTEHIAPPYDELNSGQWSFDLDALQAGNVAFSRVGLWLFTDMQHETSDIGVTPLFTIKNRVVTGGANSLSIYRGSKHKEAAWEFLKWAVQTPAQIDFARFSDVPANKSAIAQMGSYIQPSQFVPTLQSAIPTFQPGVMTTKSQLSATLADILTDMVHGKLTPAQAAAQMEQQGNVILSQT
ncbi:sugar ABC transporter substrate-binding protein [Ktedonosporobacter rubrisoli]|uniref:Sugar ABC transporter substrate-binding protein n=1 Tax=Ktedonosporobacter rubrisoli TaxID=2509675 RepID=A0A4P6JS69_KTERU|nr:sugar ABC transporter substrate-binding protein [Ktedonosporobacter rubrisoli]QBD78349.1 sugar ABC transporter substrate-binding protein [Ktedonosporobacter rubrisoli]